MLILAVSGSAHSAVLAEGPRDAYNPLHLSPPGAVQATSLS
jgi:hypothetical protein